MIVMRAKRVRDLKKKILNNSEVLEKLFETFRRFYQEPGLVEDVPAHGRGWNKATFKAPSDPSHAIPRITFKTQRKDHILYIKSSNGRMV